MQRSNSNLITIAQLIPSMNSGGVEQGVLDMNQAILEKGWQSLVISNGGRLVEKIVKQGGNHILLPIHSKNPFQIWYNRKKLEKLIQEKQISLLHARSRAPAWSSLSPAKEAKIPFVTTLHGAYTASNCFKRAYNQIMVESDAIIAVSAFVAGYAQKNYTFPSEKVSIIPRGIDPLFLNRVSVSSGRIEKIIKNWNIPQDKRLILLPARLTKIKGHEVLIDAIHQLNRSDIFCLFVGEGDEAYQKRLELLIEKKGLKHQIRIAGHCSDMQAAYFVSELVVLPSIKPESFGRVCVEAMAMGSITIASNIGGSAETMIDQKTGFLVPPNDPYALSESLQKALDLRLDEKKLIQEQAHLHVRTHFTKDKMVKATISLYEKLLLEHKLI